MSIWRALRGFTATTAVSALVSLGSIPVVIHAVGADAWAGVAVGQTVGLLFGVVAGWGWAAVGPATVAGLVPEAKPQMLADASTARVALASALCVPASVAAAIFAPPGTSEFVSMVAALNFLCMAIGPAWYFVGCAQPRRLLILDTVPRSLGTLFGMAMLGFGANVLAFVLVQLAGSGIALVLGLRVATRGASVAWRWRPRDLVAQLGANAHGLAASIGGHFYQYAPLVVVSAVAPETVAPYAMADRMLKFAAVSLAPLTQVAQGYAPAETRAERVRRVRQVRRLGAAAACLCGATFAACLPFAASVLSGGRVHLDPGLAAAFGLCLGAMVLSALVGLSGLVVLGEQARLAAILIGGALVIVPAVVMADRIDGITGVACAVAVVQAAVLAAQLVVLLYAERRELRGVLSVREQCEKAVMG